MVKEEAKSLVESKKFLHEIFEHAAVGVSIVNLEGKWLQVNKKLCKIVGYSKKELLSTGYMKLTHPEDIKKTKEFVKKFSSGKIKYGYLEKRYIHKKKQVVWVFLSVSLVKDSSGKPSYFIVITRDITQRKKAEEELKESEEKYIALFNNAVDAIFIADPITRQIIECNKKAEKLIGYSRNKLLSMRADDLHPKDIRKEAMTGFKKQLEGKSNLEVTEILSKDNKRIPVAISASSININGKEYIQGIFRDITQRKKAEEELKESEEKYIALFNNAVDAIFIADPITRQIIECNKKAEKLIGYSRNKLLSMRADDLHPKDIRKEAMTGFKKQLEGKSNLEVTEILSKDNKRIPVAISASSININGKEYIQGIFRDITQRKKAEEELKRYRTHLETLVKERTTQLSESEIKYNKIFESSSDGLLLLNKEKIITEANKAAQKILGYNKKNLIGKSILYFHKKEDYNRCKKNINKTLSGKKVECNCSYITSKNKLIMGSSSLSSLKILGKKYVLVAFKDITEKLRNQEDLKKSYEKLKELDLMKTEFLSMSSHELKTPLTPIKAQLQRIIGHEMPKSEIDSSLEIVLRNELRLEKLINDILEISRLESKKLVLDIKEVNILEVIHHVIDTIRPIIRDKNIKVKLSLEGIPKIKADHYRIEEVFINLLDNSIRHGKPKNITISASKLKDSIKICIKDDGKGISKEEQENLFNLFYQGKQARNIHVGAGLGLKISKGIIEEHGGEIWAESELGKGTLFCFTLPIKPKELKASKSIKKKEEAYK